MKVLICLLFIMVVIVTSGLQIFLIWKKREYKTFYAQLGIIGLAVAGGVLAVFNISDLFSISKLLNLLSPL